MSRWTARQVADLAPDQSSLAAARRLASPGPWSETGSTEVLVWGKCQGSGKTPYQVSVDLTGPAFRCTCPSRKFPCKHGLALLLLWVEHGEAVKDVEQAAGFARDWADQRAARATSTAEAPAKAPDPVAQAKRLEERLALMTAGMEEFALWLGDLVRGGTAAARRQPYSYWDTAAARLVDTQLPGLAEQVREMAGSVNARTDWAEHLLAAVGRWWTATRVWPKRENLDEHQTADLRAFLGWPIPTADVRATDAVTDRWLVLGAHRTDDGRIQQQRTWLWGETTHETVQVLDFAAGGNPLPVARVTGAVLDATLARYPGSAPRRALFVTDPVPAGTQPTLPAGSTLDEAYAAAAGLWARNPWAARFPVVLDAVRVAAADPAYAVDPDGASVPLTRDVPYWPLVAISGGRPVDLFGELEGGAFRPLAAVAEDGLVAV